MKSTLPAEAEKQPLQPVDPFRKVLRRTTLLCFAAALLIFSALGLWVRHRATHHSSPLPSGASVATTTEQPDETAISPQATYEVPAGQPRKITLPSIQAEGFIQKVGVDPHGAVAVPSNIHLAGWFASEPVPGDPGLSIIDGHVQGKYGPGIFKRLGDLRPGDTYSITFGDGHSRQFEVVSVTSYPTAAVGPELFKKHEAIPAQLNLITCAGSYDRTSGQYDKRILVVSKRSEKTTTP